MSEEVVSVDVNTEAAPVAEAPEEATEQVSEQVEAAEAKTEEVTEEIKEVQEEKAKEDPLSSRFALLARKEKELRDREQSAKQYEQKLKDAEEREAKAKADPIAALQAAGYSYEDATNFVLNDKQPTEDMARKVESDRIKQLETRLSERDKQEAYQKYQQQVVQYKETIGGHLDQGAEKYPLVNSLDHKKEVVYDLCESHHRETGNTLELDEACAYIEDSFRNQFKAFISTEVGKKMASELLVPAEPTKPEELKATSSNTLTNKQSTTVPTPRERRMTNEESVAEAAKILRYNEE